jgi:hypothetical protein
MLLPAVDIILLDRQSRERAARLTESTHGTGIPRD